MMHCHRIRSNGTRAQRAGCAAGLVLVPALCTAQPLYLYGVDGDTDVMVRVDVQAPTPEAELLGTVVNGSGDPVPEMEAMTWDPDLGRLIVVSNAGSGPLYRIDPDDITAPPPADIPADFVGNTNTIQMEGIALEPAESVYYAVDNTTRPSRLLRISRLSGTVMAVVGELRDSSGNGYSNVEGLAFSFSEPHVLFGADNPGEGPSQLVTIDTASGLVTPVGSGIGFVNVECLVFAPNGTLYGFSNGNALTDQFITIDTGTGAGTAFNVIDAKQFDIEGCAFLEPDVSVQVEPATWSRLKRLYRTP